MSVTLKGMHQVEGAVLAITHSMLGAGLVCRPGYGLEAEILD
jgi:hypothetical protein